MMVDLNLGLPFLTGETTFKNILLGWLGNMCSVRFDFEIGDLSLPGIAGVVWSDVSGVGL